MRHLVLLFVLLLVLPGLCLASIPVSPDSEIGNHTIYWSEDWESGAGLWNASNGVWEVGPPSYGTSESFGTKCATTNRVFELWTSSLARKHRGSVAILMRD